MYSCKNSLIDGEITAILMVKLLLSCLSLYHCSDGGSYARVGSCFDDDWGPFIIGALRANVARRDGDEVLVLHYFLLRFTAILSSGF